MVLIPDFYGIRRLEAGLLPLNQNPRNEVKDEFTTPLWSRGSHDGSVG
jgi:hypothetical protein